MIKALADETRIQILELLAGGEKNVQEIAAQFSISRPTISHHLQIMKMAGILKSRKVGKEIYYSVNMYSLTSLAQSILAHVKW
ncbi:MAG: winged helix-turn-helix transcriptional regulator [Firmicutes bacterium]|nr:winged helix-turn-helix transcriptional regulator [Bacillota bacterium]